MNFKFAIFSISWLILFWRSLSDARKGSGVSWGGCPGCYYSSCILLISQTTQYLLIWKLQNSRRAQLYPRLFIDRVKINQANKSKITIAIYLVLYNLMEIISTIWDTFCQYFTQFSVFIVSTVIITHLIFSFWPRKKLQLTKDSVIIITGGCMGIGRQMAIQFAKKYHSTILIIDRRDDLFDGVRRQLDALQCKALFNKCDLSCDKQIEQTLKFIQQSFKKIDLFIYNAGIVIPKRSHQTTPAQNNLVLKVNYFTTVRMIHALEPQLQGGHVAVVSSMFSLASGGINYSTYGASKGAIYHYISSLRQQYKKDKRNITISLACPYAINTGMFHGFKMTIEYIVPMLDEVYVGKRMVKEFVDKKQVCFMYQYAGWILRLLEMMPSQFYDWMWIHLDNSNYNAIKAKHDAQVEEQQKKTQ